MSVEKENPNIKVLTGDSFIKISDKKVKEYRVKWKMNPVKHIVDRFPIHLDIESTSICNLKCPFCAGTYEKYSYGHIEMDLYKKIVDEGSEKGLYSIKLNFRGEPLLHPEIAELVSYAKQKGIVDVFFNTNATLLTERTARKLIDAGLDRLIVSIEGYTKEIYEKNRVGGKFEKVVSNIRNFVELRQKLNSRTPILRLQTVNIEADEGYLKKYEEFWRGFADEITCIDLRDERRDYSGLNGGNWECPYPWRRLCITWDGNIYTCPFVNHAGDKYQWKGFGKIGETSLEEVWNCKDIMKIREVHRKGLSHTIEPCKFCSYRGTELSKKKNDEMMQANDQT